MYIPVNSHSPGLLSLIVFIIKNNFNQQTFFYHNGRGRIRQSIHVKNILKFDGKILRSKYFITFDPLVTRFFK
jgi:hypothetical protein